MRRFLRRLCCWLRDHPYPLESDFPVEEYYSGNVPFPPALRCSNCGAVMNRRSSGMRS